MTKEIFHTASINSLYTHLNSSFDGLSSKEALHRQATYGPNELPCKRKTSLAKQFFAQFNDFMIIILIIAAAISFIASILDGSADYIDPIIILTIIIFNAIIGLVQERNAEHSLDALKKLSAPYASVLRDGVISVIPSRNLVPGDIVILETGMLVPADIRLIKSVNLKIDESSLTGESIPSSKDHLATLSDNSPLAERKNMAYSSSMITSGHGTGIVVAIGSSTEVGHIAGLINNDISPDTPLQKNLAKTSKYLGLIALAICFIIFIVGVLQGRGLYEMFMTSISLAVASIPEGLPIIVTIVLSIGVSRMAQKNAIIRTLPAVETLGSATYICSDKTGTLTENKMTVTKICDASGPILNPTFILTLTSLCNNASVNFSKHSSNNTPTHSNQKDKTSKHSTNCNTLYNSHQYTVHGEPTETSLIYAALNNKIIKTDLEQHYPRVHEIPFDSKRKLMTTVHTITSGGHSYRYITKGAAEVVLPLCTHYYDGTSITPITTSVKNSITESLNSMTKDALRVLAVAFKDTSDSPSHTDNSQLESGLCFAGLIGMIDPPRCEAKDAVHQCILAGITPVMITGDHPKTAYAIAKSLGICSTPSALCTGAELDTLTDDELISNVKNYSVFARVTPKHKIRIVKSLQACGEIVAMTGDGVNDAPALKGADIGCAMGVNGTDVAKNASDMILADDNFSTIVSAIKQGRGIYENIRKAIHFLLSCNIGEIMTILFAILFSLPTPLLAVQLLWINLVTDSLPAISLGVEPIDKGILSKKHSKTNNFFTPTLVSKIIFEGLLIGLLTLLAFILGYKYIPLNISSLPTFLTSLQHISPSEIALITGRTMAFATLGLSQLFHAFNMKSDTSILSKKLFNNPKLILSFILCTFLQVSVISIPTLATIFKVLPLGITQWLIVFILAALPIPIIEIQKHYRKNF